MVRKHSKLFTCLLCFSICCILAIPCRVKAEKQNPKVIDFTCYVTRGTCYDGCETRKGICATDKEHIGYTALIWTLDGEFLGYYECCDLIGTEWGRSGHCIDIFAEDMDEAVEYMKITGGKCIVQYIWAEG